MTVTLGWKHVLAAAIVLAVLGVATWLTIRSIQQQSITDWERLQQIEGLSKRLQDALTEVDRLKRESDGFRDERDKNQGATAAAIARYKALKAMKDKTPQQEADTCMACELALGLMEADLILADMETLSLRRERVAMIAALADSQEMYDLQSKRLKSAQRSAKQVKRRNIWTNVSIAAASITLGFGMGRL